MSSFECARCSRPVFIRARGKPDLDLQVCFKCQRVQELAWEVGVPEDVTRAFTAISDPKNAALFSASAARKAFASVPVDVSVPTGANPTMPEPIKQNKKGPVAGSSFEGL